jgi:hypothetical protein
MDWKGSDVFWGWVVGLLMTFAICGIAIAINHGR